MTENLLTLRLVLWIFVIEGCYILDIILFSERDNELPDVTIPTYGPDMSLIIGRMEQVVIYNVHSTINKFSEIDN